MAIPSFSRNPGETTAEFKKRILLYENQRIHKTESLIDSIFDEEADPQVIHLLKDSLEYIKDAETHEELVVYQASFNEALQRIKYKDILEIDPCIMVLREYADELYYLMELNNSDSLDTRLAQIRNDLATNVAVYVDDFKKTARELTDEFNKQIQANKETIKNTEQDDYFTEKNKELEKLNERYRLGIEKMQKQKNQIDMILAILNNSDNQSSSDKRIEQRKAIAVAMQTLREIDTHAAYNHFVDECFQEVSYLCLARSNYLPKNESLAKVMGKIVWLTTKAFIPAAQIIPGAESVPEELPKLGYEMVTNTDEAVSALRHRNARHQGVASPPKQSFGQKAWGLIKKATTIVLGVSGLALSLLLCLSVIGLPKGILIAGASIGVLETVRSGSDIFSELSKSRKHAKQVLKNLNYLEQQHEELEKSEKEEKVIITQENVIDFKSEAKIDMLLMGHKLNDKLTPHEIEKLKHKPEKSAHDDARSHKAKDEVKSDVIDVIDVIHEESQSMQNKFLLINREKLQPIQNKSVLNKEKSQLNQKNLQTNKEELGDHKQHH